MDDATQMLQPSLPSGVPDDSRRTVPYRRGDCERLWKDHAARSDATCPHQGGTQGVVGVVDVGWSVVWCGVCGLECGKGVVCAVLGKGVVLSKQIGIKQGDSDKQGVWSVIVYIYIYAVCYC